MAENPTAVKLQISRDYSATPVGKELLKAVEKLERKVQAAKEDYEAQINKIGKKYGHSTFQINLLKGVMLKPSICEAFGYPSNTSIYMADPKKINI